MHLYEWFGALTIVWLLVNIKDSREEWRKYCAEKRRSSLTLHTWLKQCDKANAESHGPSPLHSDPAELFQLQINRTWLTPQHAGKSVCVCVCSEKWFTDHVSENSSMNRIDRSRCLNYSLACSSSHSWILPLSGCGSVLLQAAAEGCLSTLF